jgi:phosphatidylglycerophosphatase GEP4
MSYMGSSLRFSKEKFAALRAAYPSSRLLIVSNTAGTSSDKNLAEAAVLEKNTGIRVLQHSTKKPGCHAAVVEHFTSDPSSGVTHPSQIAVVGDRLFTDVMMANMMGGYGFWIRDGVVERKSFVSVFTS